MKHSKKLATGISIGIPRVLVGIRPISRRNPCPLLSIKGTKHVWPTPCSFSCRFPHVAMSVNGEHPPQMVDGFKYPLLVWDRPI